MRYCASCGADLLAAVTLPAHTPTSALSPRPSAPSSFLSPFNVAVILVGVIAVVAFAWVVVTNGALGTSAPSPTPTPRATASPTPVPTPCLDFVALGLHRTMFVSDMRAAAVALSSLNIPDTLSALRLASSESRAMADEMQPNDVTAASHLTRAADAIDASTTALSSFEIADASSWMGQAENEMQQAMGVVNGLLPSTYCRT
jgi:hypothetical protein